jgi:Family of unknown function (DUF6455)
MSGPTMQKITEALSRRWNAWRATRTQGADLACCDGAEVDRMAQDLGLSPEELKLLASRDPGSADLLYRRLALLGMDAETIKATLPQVMRDMQRCCSDCAQKGRCVHDLDAGTGPRMPDYCPNAETLAAVAIMKAR